MNVKDRLADVEKAVRVYRFIFVSMAVAFAALISLGAKNEGVSLEQQVKNLERRVTGHDQLLRIIDTEQKTVHSGVRDLIKARSIQIFDKNNKVRILLTTLDDKGLVAFTGIGKGIGTTIQESSIQIYNKDDKAAISIGLTGSGHAAFNIKNTTGRKIVQIGSSTEGTGFLQVNNESEKEAVSIGLTESGEGTIKGYTRAGHRLWELGASTEDASGAIGTYNKKGILRTLVGSSQYGGRVQILDKAGKLAIIIGVEKDGTGQVAAKGKRGTIRGLQTIGNQQ